MKKYIIFLVLAYVLFLPRTSWAIDKVTQAHVYFLDSMKNVCGQTYIKNPNVRGCYSYKTKNLYVKNEKFFTGAEMYKNSDYMEFTLYHEFGHHLFKLDFPRNLFENEEYMADGFGIYIMLKKHPIEYAPNANQLLSYDQYDYFKKNFLNTSLGQIIPFIKRGTRLVSYIKNKNTFEVLPTLVP